MLKLFEKRCPVLSFATMFCILNIAVLKSKSFLNHRIVKLD
jgi:hypothetical protein